MYPAYILNAIQMNFQLHLQGPLLLDYTTHVGLTNNHSIAQIGMSIGSFLLYWLS